MKRSIESNGFRYNVNNNDNESWKSVVEYDVSCRDSYEFLMELGGEATEEVEPPRDGGESGKKKKKYANKRKKKKAATAPPPRRRRRRRGSPLPDHVLMNYPLDGPKFLGAIRWWSSERLVEEGEERGRTTTTTKKQMWRPRFRVYTFSRESRVGERDEEEMAVNVVADELLPQLPPMKKGGDDDDSSSTTAESSSSPPPPFLARHYRRKEMNEEFDADVRTRTVRDVAPGKVVVLVSFDVTPKLIRYMQGDYS